MPIAEYKVQRSVVKFPGGEFEVRGISLPDVALIINLHESSISMIVDLVYQKKESFASMDEGVVQEAITDLISSLIRESPILIATIIAVCADEESQMSMAQRLPITVQLDALTKISELTFTDMASVKKLAADVMRLIRGIIPSATARSAKKRK